MDNLEDIFDPQVDAAGDDANDLDMELASAGAVLQKIAETEGVDLDALSEEDVADLLTMLHGGGDGDARNSEPTIKEANLMDDQNLTVADVAVELAKVAAANNVDLDAVSREEYHEAFEALAEQMNDPTYFEKQAEMGEKLAEADHIGRHMAHAFLAELNEGDPEKTAASLREAYAVGRGLGGMGRARAAWEALRHTGAAGGRAGWAGAKALPGRAAAKEKDLSGRLGALLSGTKSRSKSEALQKAQRALGRGALGVGGAAVGTGAVVASRDKKAVDETFEQDAINFANFLLMENDVIEPTAFQFSKLAQAEDPSYDEAVEARAIELLRENGYSV
jgi:hypothetical protein